MNEDIISTMYLVLPGYGILAFIVGILAMAFIGANKNGNQLKDELPDHIPAKITWGTNEMQVTYYIVCPKCRKEAPEALTFKEVMELWNETDKQKEEK